MRTGTRGRGARLALLLCLGLASACVRIPAATTPVTVTEVSQGLDSDQGVQIEPLAPRAGQPPDEVVRGFLAASASTTRGRPVARQFLTTDASQTWHDDAGVTVVDQDFAAVPVTDGAQVVLTGRVLGEVDLNGVYAGGPVELRLTFTMVQVSGQWRIENPPAGVILTEDDFGRAYTRTNLYFLDPTGTVVVPDPRYFLTGSAARANSLVEELLRGPSPFLAPAVRTELAAGTQLVSNVQESRDVLVSLTGLGERSPQSLQGLSAQLVWTLKQLPITSVSITADGRPLVVPGVGTQQQTDDWQSYDPDAVPADTVGHFLTGGAVVRADGTPVAGPAGTGAYGLVSAGANADQTILAGVAPGADGAALLVGSYGEELQTVLGGPSFTAPSLGGTAQEVWTVRGGSEVIRVPARAEAQIVAAPELAPLGPVTALRISRDGARAALVVGSPGIAQLYLARVVRSSAGVELAGLTRLAPGLRDVRDVTWATADAVLIVAPDPADGRARPWQVSVDGASVVAETVSGLPDQPTGIAAAPGRATLVSAADTLWQLSSSIWRTLVRGQPVFAGQHPFYPG